MGKWCHDDFLDAAFDELIDNVITMTVCSDQPTTRNEALVTYALGDVTMDSWDYTVGDGVVSGRRLTIANKPILIDANGTANHLALVDATRLLYVTTLTPKVVSAGEMKTVLSWSIEIRDPQ